MRLFINDHMMCSEFIVVVRYLYQLLVVCDTIVLVAISLVFYFRCQILVVSYSVLRHHSCQISQLSDISFQLSVVRLSASIDIGSCWRYQLLCILNHINCLLIKEIITRGTGVIA